MGFFDKIRSGRLFFGKKEPNVVLEFKLDGVKYIVEEFDLEFNQDIDFKGIPNGSIEGGLIYLTISDIPDDNINSWMMDPYKHKEGEFRFLVNDGMIREGALMQIFFEEAYCINYQKTINPQGAGVLTSLTISSKRIIMGNEEFEKRWK